MAVSHDPYCDESHQPRQRYNDALAPTPDALNVLTSRPEPAPAAIQAGDPALVERIEQPVIVPPPSDSIRDAVVAGSMPAASPYATRAWEDTARALNTVPDEDDHTRLASPESGPSGPNVSLIVGVLLVLVLIGALRLRPRRRGRDDDSAGGQS
ncbi:MAG: hypothetical protein ABI658_32325 [Acidimicrobiales bacterium]